MIGKTLGNYQVVRCIGQGGMGVVFEAVHAQIRRRAAIKMLHAMHSRNEEIVRRFFNEALAVNVVDHPGVVGIFESGRGPDGSAYIVMEYLAGESLLARVKREGPLPEAEALRICRQIASALTAAHGKGIIHRDLKEDNVMLVPDPEVSDGPRVKILDFGIAKVAAEHQINAVRTKDGVCMGTPEYMAPEQWMSAGAVDDRADVYSLGVILFRMVSGRYPFFAQNVNQWMMRHLYDVPDRLRLASPRVSAELEGLVGRMLAKTRGGRPTMAEVAAEVQGLLERAAGSPAALSQAEVQEHIGETLAGPLQDMTVPMRRESVEALLAPQEETRGALRVALLVMLGAVAIAGVLVLLVLGLWRQ